MHRNYLVAGFIALALVCACSPGYVTPPPAVGGGGGGQESLSSSAQTITLPTVSNIASTITVAGTGTVTASDSATSPSGTPTISAAAPRLRSDGSTTNTPVLFITVTAVTAVTLSSWPAISLALPSAPSGTYYEAEWTGSQWINIPGGKAATVDGRQCELPGDHRFAADRNRTGRHVVPCCVHRLSARFAGAVELAVVEPLELALVESVELAVLESVEFAVIEPLELAVIESVEFADIDSNGVSDGHSNGDSYASSDAHPDANPSCKPRVAVTYCNRLCELHRDRGGICRQLHSCVE